MCKKLSVTHPFNLGEIFIALQVSNLSKKERMKEGNFLREDEREGENNKSHPGAIMRRA